MYFDAHSGGFNSFETDYFKRKLPKLYTLLICIAAESLKSIHVLMHVNHICVPQSLLEIKIGFLSDYSNVDFFPN